VQLDIAVAHLLAARTAVGEAERARHLAAARASATEARSRGGVLEPGLEAALGLAPAGAAP